MKIQIIASLAIVVCYLFWFMCVLGMTTPDATIDLKFLIWGTISALLPFFICLTFYFLNKNLFGFKPLYALILTSYVTLGQFTDYNTFPKLLFNHLRGISNRGYSQYKNDVYFNGERTDAVGESFKTIVSRYDIDNKPIATSYARDSQSIFYLGQQVEHADPIAFRMVSEINRKALYDDSEYMTDGKHIYSSGKVVENLDAKTFHQLLTTEKRPTPYYADEKNVYWRDRKLEGLNSNSARPMNEIYIEDGKKLFWFDSQISGINVKLAKLGPDLGEEVIPILLDDKKVFFKGSEIKGLSAEDVVFLPEGYAKSKDSVFYLFEARSDEQRLKGANPKLFKSYPYDESTKSDAFDGKTYYLNGFKKD